MSITYITNTGTHTAVVSLPNAAGIIADLLASGATVTAVGSSC